MRIEVDFCDISFENNTLLDTIYRIAKLQNLDTHVRRLARLNCDVRSYLESQHDNQSLLILSRQIGNIIFKRTCTTRSGSVSPFSGTDQHAARQG